MVRSVSAYAQLRVEKNMRMILIVLVSLFCFTGGASAASKNEELIDLLKRVQGKCPCTFSAGDEGGTAKATYSTDAKFRLVIETSAYLMTDIRRSDGTSESKRGSKVITIFRDPDGSGTALEFSEDFPELSSEEAKSFFGTAEELKQTFEFVVGYLIDELKAELARRT